MKLAYLSTIDKAGGVNKKIFTQMQAWREQGHIVQSFFMSHQNIENVHSYLLWKRFNLLNPNVNLLLNLYRFKPDCIYMREDTFMLFYVFLFAFFNKKIVIEVNADYKDEGMVGKKPTFTNKRVFFVNLLFHKFCYKLAAGLVLVTYELQKRSQFADLKNCCVIPNAINGKDWPIRKKVRNSDKIRLFFIGSPNQPWHGIDILTSWAKNLGDSFEIHIVGETHGDSVVNNVFYHGYLTDYNHIAENMDIGIGTLALYRKNLMEACSLKVREYLAMGLPVIIGYNDTAFLDESYDFILTIKNIENNLDNPDVIQDVNDFCRKFKNYVVSYEQVYNNIDVNVLERKRLEHIKSWLK